MVRMIKCWTKLAIIKYFMQLESVAVNFTSASQSATLLSTAIVNIAT